MPLIDKDNILATQYMYVQRIEYLRTEVTRIVNRGLQLGEVYETETMFALDEIEKELEYIDECLEILKYLLWQN